MNFQIKMLRIAGVALLIAIIIFITACWCQAATKHRRADNYREQVMNETLTQVLIVGSNFRTQGKHPTWNEISDEVARRMKLKRKPLP